MLHSSTLWRRSLVAALVVLFAACAEVFAVPLSTYHENLKQAIQTLEALKVDDDEVDVDEQITESTKTIRSILPEKETVEFEGDVYNIDNSWLHKSLDELDRSDDPSHKVSEILDSLRALEARVADRQIPGQLVNSKEQSKNKLDSILKRPEYATGERGSNALFRLLQDLAKWIEGLFPKRGIGAGGPSWVGTLVRVMALALAALVIGYVLKILVTWFLDRSERRTKTRKKTARIVLGEKLEPEATSTDLLSAAELLARQGDLRAAIRKAYIALLVELGDRKLISLAQHKTNRDYLNSLRNVPTLHSRMRGLTDSFERHWYGFEATTPNDWQDFRAGYVAALEGGAN